MSSLKGLLFNQYANDGLTHLVEEMQNKYKPKKGRRFNHSNITYEISRPNLKNNAIEFEISSKLPEDELKSSAERNDYFAQIKKIISAEKKKPVSIQRENIVWDSTKEREKERDYVKLVYQYPLDALFDDKAVQSQYEKMRKEGTAEALPSVPSASTAQGKLVLIMVRSRLQEIGRAHIDHLIKANKEVRTALKN